MKERMVSIMRNGRFSNYEELAELLIKEGFGDIKAFEEEQIKELREHREFCAIADKKVKEVEHRAEVAERALELLCKQANEDTESYGYCSFYSLDEYIEQAEQELTEERK